MEILGINGMGRIGKLTLWHHIARKHFDEIVVNLGRKVGRSIEDIAHYISRDSSCGRLETFLHGNHAEPVIKDINADAAEMNVDGVRVRFLLEERNPARIDWKSAGARLVVDTTGQFRDPSAPADSPRGAVRGHLEGGAEKVIVSAPFKFKDKSRPFPEDSVTTVMGINDSDYDPRRHRIISNASCTTNCLAHMMKPLLNMYGSRKILSASMATVHAATSSQPVLDRLPKSGVDDLRKNRSVMNNIILTTTGAAEAVRLVIPEMEEIGFIAESVRIPNTTGSLIILVMNFQEDPGDDPIRRDSINEVYRQAAKMDARGYLRYSESQNVSGDIIGYPRCATLIEGHETHTRTGEVTMDLGSIPGLEKEIGVSLKDKVVRVHITQAVIYGWYDNEMGSYVHMLGDRTVSIAEDM
ncbi:MAG: glyceraldehyde-3-phosphate dehydrogenase [Desulfobacterales bacterium]|nr:MAG: glyceraldehyde-3-phosphate dehydrogenase [Desulfobacterales bacterium]